MVAALTVEGIVATTVLDGAMDGEMFKAYVGQMLAPILKPGDIVIWDNLPAHRVGGVTDIVEKAGACLLKLPPYSPDPRLRGDKPQSVYGWLLRVKDIGSDLMNRSVAAMYTASEYAAGSLRALMNVRLENRSDSIERARSASD